MESHPGHKLVTGWTSLSSRLYSRQPALVEGPVMRSAVFFLNNIKLKTKNKVVINIIPIVGVIRLCDETTLQPAT